MTLQLLRNFSRFLELRPASQEELQGEKFKLRFGPTFPAEPSTKFAVLFEAVVVTEGGMILTTEYYSVFETSDTITDEFKESHFLRSNAPAIGFPFLRACFAQVCLMAGHKHVVIPSVNFVERSKDPQHFITAESPLVLETSEA
jgi:preprotein translocase subunit SecB